MKYLRAALFLFFGVNASNPAYGLESESNLIDSLTGVTAVQAMKMANDWRWSHESVKSYVTGREVVFEFPSGVVKKVPLPVKEMIVAVAPFINQTHR